MPWSRSSVWPVRAAGARSLVAIAEWAADAPAVVLAGLGVRRHPCGGALVVPSETTIRRVLSDADPGALDEQLAGCQHRP